jgi:hypothetical protein
MIFIAPHNRMASTGLYEQGGRIAKKKFKKMGDVRKSLHTIPIVIGNPDF